MLIEGKDGRPEVKPAQGMMGRLEGESGD